MEKFLYITDREEYTEHNFIGPLFEKYLPKLMDVDIVYLTKYKSYFEKRDGRFIVPIHEKKDILKYLSENNVDVSQYDYVVVRNMYEILENILQSRDKYNIKVGYRLSFPKLAAKLEHAKAENRSNILLELDKKVRTYTRTKLINKCDIFLPTSQGLKDIYCPDVTTKTHIIRSGIDPDKVHSKISRGDDKIIFAYNGTLSKLRDFRTVLEAFNELEFDNWKLYISTKDRNRANECLEDLNLIQDKVEVTEAETKNELLNLMAKCDVGLSLLPNINIFNTSIHLKTVDYYTTAVPTLMTNSDKNREIFTDNVDAWLCDFDKNSILKKLNEIMNTPKDKMRAMGVAGQAQLLEKRDYRKIASMLCEALKLL
jgi:glycosyltransferase involved in cell wall biosynthesis